MYSLAELILTKMLPVCLRSELPAIGYLMGDESPVSKSLQLYTRSYELAASGSYAKAR
jgi:hypothetical protein